MCSNPETERVRDLIHLWGNKRRPPVRYGSNHGRHHQQPQDTAWGVIGNSYGCGSWHPDAFIYPPGHPQKCSKLLISNRHPQILNDLTPFFARSNPRSFGRRSPFGPRSAPSHRTFGLGMASVRRTSEGFGPEGSREEGAKRVQSVVILYLEFWQGMFYLVAKHHKPRRP